MLKNRPALGILLVIALLAGATPALANGPEVYAYPVWEGNVVEATTQDSIHFFWGWFAVTKGLVRVYQNHSAETYILRGPDREVVWEMSAKEADTHWGPIQLYDRDWVEGSFGLVCPKPTMAGSWWEVVIPPLEDVGTYTLEMFWVYEQPVNDGFHTCTELPGTLPVPTPSLYRGAGVITSTIIVSPP